MVLGLMKRRVVQITPLFSSLVKECFLIRSRPLYISTTSLREKGYADYADTISSVLRTYGVERNWSENEERKILKVLCHSEVQKDDIINSVLLLKKEGIKGNTLVAWPWVLTYKPKTLEFRIKCLKNFHHDINVSIPLLEIPMKQLTSLSIIANKESHIIHDGNRINFLSKFLQCKPEVVSKVLVRYTFLLRVPLQRLVTNVDLLKEAKVPPESIMRDLWVLRYNPDTVQQRFTRAKNAGVTVIRPWFVRCPESTFKRMLKKKEVTKKELGDCSVKNYLSRRLECTEELIELMNKKTPQVLRSSVPRLKRIIDFLFDEGYTAADIRNSPRVFTRKKELLQSRMNQLRRFGFNPVLLSLICRSKKDYEKFINNINQVHM